MGKSTPKAPTPIDPVATANAQSAANIQTAEAQQKLNMLNQTSPYGSVEYVQDPNAPGGYTQRVTLSADQQAKYNALTNAEKMALGLTQDQIGRVQQALANQQGAPNLQLSLDYQGNPIQQGSIVSGVNQTPLNGAIANVGNGPRSFEGAGQIQGNVGTGGQLRYDFASGGPVTTSIGSAGNVAGDFNPGSINLATGVQGQGSIASSYNTPGGLQSGVSTGNPLQQSFANTNVQQSVGPTDFTADRQAVTDSVWQQALARLDPQYGKRQNDLNVMLANRGIGMNSDAYGNAQDIEGRARNDAYGQALYSAIQQGANEQNTLFGQSLAQGQFANQASGQQYNQNLGLAQFQNQAALDSFGRDLAAGQFANQAQQQAYNQAQGSAEFQNAAQQQSYGQAMGNAQLQNAAAAQQYQQNLGQAQFQNAAQQQVYDQQLGRAQFANQAQGQQFGQNAAQADFYNQQQLVNDQRLMDMASFANQAQQQQFAQNQAQAQFQSQAQQQAFNQEQARTQMQNEAAQAAFQQQLLNAYLNNSAQGQDFNQALQLDQNAFNQWLQSAQFGNTAQQQNFQNQSAAANMPINQLSALLGLGQVQMPGGVNYSPTQIAPTDYLGAVSLNAQQQQNAYNAQMQQSNGFLSGLFGLGSAAIGLSDERLKKDVVKVGTRKDGLGVYLFRYLWDQAVHLGVMAQEVLWVKPEAVVKTPSGYFAVDYSQLEPV